jgi:hypothetical protein
MARYRSSSMETVLFHGNNTCCSVKKKRRSLYLREASDNETGTPAWVGQSDVSGIQSILKLFIVFNFFVYIYLKYTSAHRIRGTSVSIVSDYGLDEQAIGVRSPSGAKDFSVASVSRPALRSTQPPAQWVPGVLSLGQGTARA